MEIKEIKDKEIWQEFVSSFEMAQFLQSWQWGEFQESLGRKIWRFGIYKLLRVKYHDRDKQHATKEEKKLIGVLPLIKNNLPLGKSYLYSPRAPSIIEAIPAEVFIDKIKEIGKKENSIFWRVDLLNKHLFEKVNFKKFADVQPSKIILLDLTKSEKEILVEMHYKTRYNIRLAEKKGVAVREGKGEKDINSFLKLLGQTSQRDGFKSWPARHYQKMFELENDFIKLFLAEYQGKVLAANLMIYFADTCTYLHGASSDENKNVMAPHLLHWFCIKEAKKMGFKYYDFGGIDKKKWPGVTRFKKSFISPKTSQEFSYPGTFDFVLDKFWYQLYYLTKRVISH